MTMTELHTATDFAVEPGKKEIVITSIFDASPEQVFRALINPKLIPDWWGPRIYKTTVERMDVRPGGKWRFIQVGPDGTEHGFHGEYREVLPPHKLVYTFEYEGMPGHVQLETIKLQALAGGRTKVIDTVTYDTVEERDAVAASGMQSGAIESMERFGEVLRTAGVRTRKVILFNLMSLDGFFTGPEGDISWHNVDEEFNDFAIDQLNEAGGLLFGRVTYEMMASYWPNAEDDPEVANLMNTLPKVVFSRTLSKADWNNTTLVQGDLVGEVKRLKQQPGKDLYLFGSADVASALASQGLIDEYRVLVNPLILGSGKPLFHGIQQKLRLVSCRTFQNGNVLLTYEPDG